MKVNVYSAESFNVKQRNKLTEILASVLRDKNLELTLNYSTDLISGLRVEYGSKVIDLTMSGKIDRLRDYLTNG